MKKPLLFTLALLALTTLAYAQAHRDAVPSSDGIDTISMIIGLVVGLIIGYLIGNRMSKK